MINAWSFRALRAGLLVVLTLATGAVGVSIWQDRSNAIDDGVRDARNVAVVLAGQIERSIQSVDVVLRGVQQRLLQMDLWSKSTGPIRIANSQAFRQSLLELLALLPQAFQIVVTDDRGELVMSTANWPTPNINIADREHFQELLAHDDDRLVISLPLANRVTGESTMVLARRIGGPYGNFAGIVFVSVRTTYFEGVYESVKALPHQSFIMARRDGTVLFRYPDTQERSGQKIPSNSSFYSAVERGGGSYRSLSPFDQIARRIAIEPLKTYGLDVGIGVAEEEMLRQWRWRTTAVILGTAIVLMCALFLLRIMARQYHVLSASEASLAEKSQALEREHASLLEKDKALKQEHVKLLRSDAALRVQMERFDVALNNMSRGFAMYDNQARLVVCNDYYRNILGLSPDQARPGCSLRGVIEYTQRTLGVPTDLDAYIAEAVRSAAAGQYRTREIQDNRGRVISITYDSMPNGGWVATYEDITDRRASEKKIERLAHNDILTGIANRPSFLEHIDKARQRLQADGNPFSVLMLDLDRFKHVNDSLGHAAGDTLLKETANRLQASLRSTDFLARLGGDEFAIVQTPPREFEEIGDAPASMRESAIVLANRVIELISEPYEIDGHKVVIGTSIGIAMAPDDAIDPDELMKKADLALYKTKSEGRNGYSFFDTAMTAAADERRQLETDLRDGLRRGEFELYYQPQVDLATGQTCSMEALVRWRHPTQGLIAPERFIPLAEDTGLITSLGEWILQTACAEATHWPSHVKVALNVSPVHIRKTNLFDVIMCALVDSRLPPDRLEIEITERVLQEQEAEQFVMLHQLKSLGISIALDDFGSGYSSLGYLTTFPFNKIKIDRSFTRDILIRPDCAAIVGAIGNLGRALDIVTVAEAVETEDQIPLLRTAGLTHAQGLLFGRPTPASDIRFDNVDHARNDELFMRRA